MPLQKQLVPVTFKGLDRKTSPRLSVPGSLVTLENGRQPRIGEFGKRDGSSPISMATVYAVDLTGAGTAITAGKRLGVKDKDLILFTGDRFYVHSPDRISWTDRGALPLLTTECNDVISGTFNMSMPDAADIGNLRLFVWEDARLGATVLNLLRWSLLDTSTGTFIATDRNLPSSLFIAQRPRVLVSGTTFYVLAMAGPAGGGSAGQFEAWKMPTSALTTWAAMTDIATDVIDTATGDPHWDAQVLANGDFLLAYRISTTQIKALVWRPSTGATITGPVTLTVNATKAIAWLNQDFSGSSYYLVTAGATNGIIVRTLSAALAVTATETIDATATDADNMTGYWDGTSKVVYWEKHRTTAGKKYTTCVKRGTYTGSATVIELVYSVGLASKVFKVGTKYYVLCAYESDIQSGYFLMDQTVAAVVSDSPARPIARALYGACGGLTVRQGHLPSATLVSATKVSVACTTRVGAAAVGDFAYSLGIANLIFDFASSHQPRTANANGDLMIPGGLTGLFDGASYVEAGFHVFPEICTLAAAGAGSLTADTTYQYCLVYSWVNKDGKLVRSAPSVPVSLAITGANRTINVSAIPPLSLTHKHRGADDNRSPVSVLVEIYRTTGNGTIFYRTATVENNPVGGTVNNYSDTVADSVIQLNEILYTEGDVLDNFPPPPSRYVAIIKDRVFVVRSDRPGEIWVSKQMQPGIGLAFSPDLVIRCDGPGGDVMAVAEVDDKIAILKRTAVYVTSGEGPNDQGQGMFPAPVPVSLLAGTEQPESVASGRDGVWFQSAKGLTRLSRALEVEYFGAQVEDMTTGLTITAPAVLESAQQLRLFSSAGTTLVWDYFAQQWYVDTGQAAVDAAVWNGIFVRLASNGVVTKEVAGQYNDNGTAIITKLKTAPISFAGIGGFQRMYRLKIVGEYKGNHTLRVTLTYPGDKDGSLTSVFDQVVTAGPFEFMVKPKHQRCTEVVVQIEDVYPGAASQGFTITAMAFVVGVMPGKAGTVGSSQIMTPT